MSSGGYKVNGKTVRCWLFARAIRLPQGRQTSQCVQVEGFDLDHAWRRLKEHERFGANWVLNPWEMLDELGPEHDVGYLGEKLPLFIAGVVLNPSKSKH